MQLLLIEIAGCLDLQCMGAVAASIYVGVKSTSSYLWSDNLYCH